MLEEPSYPPTVPPREPEEPDLDRMVPLRAIRDAFQVCAMSGRFGALELARTETAVMRHVRAHAR
jgi:hypothetical protein